MISGSVLSNAAHSFVREILTFCGHSLQLILRPYYVFIAAISRGRYLHQGANFAERLPTIPELIGSINTSAFPITYFVGTAFLKISWMSEMVGDDGS
jgi:hypothetical protein